MPCLDLDSNTEAADGGEPLWGGAAFSLSEPATPRERKIWEDVVSMASCAEAMSKVVELYDTTGIAISSFPEGCEAECSI
jgi:hypothetical protein